MLLRVFEARLSLGIDIHAPQGGKEKKKPNHKSSPLICVCSARK